MPSKFDALSQFAGPTPTPTPESRLIEVDPAELLPSEHQYRLWIDEEEIQALAEVFKQQGFFGAVWVYHDDEGNLRAASGARRAAAAKLAGLSTIPADLIEGKTPAEIAELGYQANAKAKALNLLEDTLAVLNLLSLNTGISEDEVTKELYRLDNAKGSTQSALGSQILELCDRILGPSKWRSFVKARLPLLKLPPDVMEAVRRGQIEGTKALAVAKVKDEEARATLLEDALAEEMSLRDIQERVRELKPEPAQPPEFTQRACEVMKRVKRVKVEELPQRKRSKLEKLLAELESLLE